ERLPKRSQLLSFTPKRKLTLSLCKQSKDSHKHDNHLQITREKLAKLFFFMEFFTSVSNFLRDALQIGGWGCFGY
uniref:Uncharacterized protein n=1 Tax=Oryzias latipes TaxID=8090 RepID=A0A3P9JWS7_ORYLA